VTLSLCACGDRGETVGQRYPGKPIKVIVPFAAGGGSDTFARVIQMAVRDHGLLSQPLVIINVKGAGGTVGSRRVKEARPDGHTILNLHEGILTAKHSGAALYGPEAFEAIAATGETGMLVCVREDAPYSGLAELLAAAAAEPDTILAGANLGAPSYFALKRVEDAAPDAAVLRYVQAGGGAERFADLLGGHVTVSAFSVSEYEQFREGGLRALAYLGEERHPAAPEVPTAREQGIGVVHSNMQFWWAPLGTPRERVEALADTLEDVMSQPSVRAKLVEMQIDPVFLRGAALKKEIARRGEAIAAVDARTNVAFPNLALLVMGATVALAVWVLVQWRRTPRDPVGGQPPEGLSFKALAIGAGFVALLQSGVVPFVVAASLVGLVWGVSFLSSRRDLMAGVMVAAVAVSVGCHFLFTRILVIDLP
jgi:tripartite-type tricarboxylate transporter receptor subunit TctC